MSGETRSVVVRLSLDTAQAIRGSKEFGAEFGRAMDQAEKRTGSAGRAMDQLGGTAGKMALGAAAGLAAIIGTTANFDEAMSHVAATGDDARSSIDALREAAIQAGQDTAFSASEAAAGVENLAKAGVSAKDILGGGLKGSLDLAAAGGLEVADAAEVAATAMTQFKLSGQDVPHIADLLAAAAGKAQGDVSDMAFALKQSGLVASQMGISIEETTGTLAAFASAGLLGSDAGTSFRTMLLRLANPTTESADLMAHLGLQAYDAQGNFVGMASVAGQLQAALQGKTQAERDSALATIFGSDAIRAASVLYEQGADGITKWTGNVDDAGYAAETASTRMDNLKGDLEQFKGSLETALIGAGEGSQGSLRGLVQDATKLVNVFNDAPPAIQGTVTKMLALVAITGGAAWFGSKIIRGINDTRQALSDLGLTSDTTAGKLAKVAKTAVGIVAVGTAVGALADSINRIDPENIDRSLDALDRGEVTDTIDGIVKSLRDLEGIGDPLSFLGDSLAEGVTLGGIFGDTSKDKAADNIDLIDQKLAQLVETGQAVQAQDFFTEIAAQAEAGGVSVKDTTAQFDKYALALRNAGLGSSDFLNSVDQVIASMLDQGPAAEDATGATDDLKVAQQKAKAAAKDLRDELRAQREEARTTAKGFVSLGDSLNDSKTSLNGWLRDLEKQADALRNFRLNAIKAAHEGLDRGLIKSLQEAGPEGALRMRQLANATDAELRRANKAWRDGQAEIRRYVDFKVPPKKITVDDGQARRAITSIGDMLSRLDGKVARTYIDTIQRGYSIKRDNMNTSADGGSVPKDGGPYADRHLYMLAPGEEIISNRHGQADAFRRDRASGAIPGYANGGTIGRGSAAYAQVGAGGTPMFQELLGGAGAASSALFNLAGLGKKELQVRARLLEKEVERDQKAVDLAKQHRDAVLDDIKSLKDSIANRFKSDLFAQQQSITLDGPEGGPTTAAQSLQWALAQQTVNAAQQQSPVDILRADLANLAEAQGLYRDLKQAGLSGAALTYAQEHASNEQLAALLDDPKMLRQYERLYGQREHRANQLGATAAFQRYGDELHRSNATLDRMEAELRESKAAERRATHLLEQIQKNTKDGPKKTAEHTSRTLGNAAGAAARRR